MEFQVQKSIEGACGLLGAELIVQCDSCRKKGPAIPFHQTLHSVTEGAAQCCDGVLQGMGVVVHQRRQLRPHRPLSHHLQWVKQVSQDRASPPYTIYQVSSCQQLRCLVIQRKWPMPQQSISN